MTDDSNNDDADYTGDTSDDYNPDGGSNEYAVTFEHTFTAVEAGLYNIDVVVADNKLKIERYNDSDGSTDVIFERRTYTSNGNRDYNYNVTEDDLKNIRFSVGDKATITLTEGCGTNALTVLFALSNNAQDFDGDGVANTLDLDSDNDGIYDAVEAGHGQAHTNGRVSIASVGSNGLLNALESSDASDATMNYTVLNTDNSGAKNYLDLDSDDDNCHDVVEALFTDSSEDGYLGVVTPVNVDANGIVTSSPDGYTTPDGNYLLSGVKTVCTTPLISIYLSTNEVTELNSSSISYTITRSGTDVGSTTVNFTVAGTASAGDYGLSETNSITFSDGETSKTITLTPTNDNSNEPDETVILNITPSPSDADYILGSGNSATATIKDNDNNPTGGNDDVTTNEDINKTFASGDFTFSDVDGDSFSGIKIITVENSWRSRI